MIDPTMSQTYSIDDTIARYESLLREYKGNPPEEDVTYLIRRHGPDKEDAVIRKMLEVEIRLGYG